MDGRRIDDAARLLAGGHSRRRVLSLLARGTVAAGLGSVGSSVAVAARKDEDEDKDKDKGNGPACRGEGHPCEGNQTCCDGLTCAASGPGAARRCTAGTAAECEEDCPPAESVIVVVGPDIDIEADCAFSGEMRRTTCTFTAAAGEGTVGSIAVPVSMLCAEVLDGDFAEVDLGANARPETKGLKSTRTEGGTAVVTIELAGEVTTAGIGTYWCETDQDALIPVTGPGLTCEKAKATPASDVSDSTGAVVVQTYACDVGADEPDVDWFGGCDASTAEVTFRLLRPDGGDWVEVGSHPTDAEGLCRFGHLAPGTYQLEQTEGSWCHAESDSVDKQGQVIVKAGARATVWVFSCPAAK
jgi:hypothetical protein